MNSRALSLSEGAVIKYLRVKRGTFGRRRQERWHPGDSVDGFRSGYEQQVSGIDSVNNRLVDVHCDFSAAPRLTGGACLGPEAAVGPDRDGYLPISSTTQWDRWGRSRKVTPQQTELSALQM